MWIWEYIIQLVTAPPCRFLQSACPAIHCVESSKNHRESQGPWGSLFPKRMPTSNQVEVEVLGEPPFMAFQDPQHLLGSFYQRQLKCLCISHFRIIWERYKPMTIGGFRLGSLQRSQVVFISELHCKNRAKRRGSKRTLQGTVGSMMKVTVSCLLTNLILPQGPCSVLTGPVCQWLWVNSLKAICFHFTY